MEVAVKEDVRDVPYELPKGWEWVRLEDISVINPRKTEVRQLLAENKDVSFVPMGSVDAKSGEIVNSQIKSLNKVYKGYTYFKEGDIIFAKITPCMENGKCAIAERLENGIGFGSTEFHVVRLNELINKKWLWYLLRLSKTKQEAKKHFTGAVGQKRVPDEFLKNLFLPFPFKNNHPDLGIQTQIVEKIEAIFQKIGQAERLRQTALEKTKAVFDAVLNKTFREAEESEGWEWVKLGDQYYFKVETGGTPKTAVIEYWDKGYIKWITPKDLGRLNSDFIDETERKITEKGLSNSSATVIPKGSIIISTRAPIGYMATLNDDMCFNQGCKGIIIKSSNILNKFVYYVLSGSKKALIRLGQGATFKELSKTSLKNFSIPLPFANDKPDFAKQEEIVSQLDNLQQKIRQLEELQNVQLQKFQALRESILNKVFRGQLL